MASKLERRMSKCTESNDDIMFRIQSESVEKVSVAMADE